MREINTVNMHNYKDLKVWKLSMDIAEAIYQLTSAFPSDEKFGLVSQMKRASVSIVSNIAEGAGRNSNKEFSQFLSIANGSVCELETQLLLSQKLEMIENSKKLEVLFDQLDHLQKMIFNLKGKIR